jgi:MFS family permease
MIAKDIAMPTSNVLPLSRRLADAFAMLVVAAVSLVLLIYVAFGEAKRTYEQFQIDKLVAQGQVVQTAVEQFVRPGLPIQQYVGFNQLAEPMVRTDPLIDAIGFFDMNETQIFISGDAARGILSSPSDSRRIGESGAELRQQSGLLQVILPVRNRFEQVGHVVLSVPRAKIASHVEDAFRPMLYTAVAASLAFGLFVFLFSHRFAPAARNRWIGGAFSAMFMAVAVIVVSTLISVYAQGAQARAKSLADSLGQRLDDLIIYNINLDDITGIIGLFGDYKRLNPEIRAAALIVDGKVRAHIDPKMRGDEWDHVADDYEYAVDLSQASNPRSVQVKVALPKDIVWRQVTRSVKNFAALFVASAFLAALFMGVARSLQRVAESHTDGKWTALEERAVIALIKPVFFLAVFVEHLSYAFLPSLMQSVTAAAQLPPGLTTLPFAAYYLMFALSLVPAGRLEQRVGAKNLIMFGLTLAGAGLGIMVFHQDFWTALFARALSGVGQGVLFIGVQVYVLANSSPEQRTQAGGAIVFGFQAGMIAGMAIGSLLVSYLGMSGVFTLGASISAVTALYALMALPNRVSGGEMSATMHSAWNDMWFMLRNGAFARSILLVGMPAKAVLTGVILFAMPLLLVQQGFAREDVGQITMIYAGAVILASHFAAIKTDRTSNTETILFQGTSMSALGLGLIAMASYINWSATPVAGTLLIVAGVILVGFAHGCINAPIVTHISQTEAASRYGVTNAAAAYRLIERLGHIVGPVIVGQLFLHFGTSWSVLAWIAAGVFLMGVFFLSPVGQSKPASRASDPLKTDI